MSHQGNTLFEESVLEVEEESGMCKFCGFEISKESMENGSEQLHWGTCSKLKEFIHHD